jgi:hypothetical protein
MRSAQSDPSSVSVAISLVLPIYCSCYLHNLNQRNSMRLFPDLTNQIGQGHLRQGATRSCTGLRKRCPFDRRIDLSTVLAPHKGSTREPQRVLNRLKHRQVIVGPKNAVPVQNRSSIHGYTPLAMDCSLLNDGFHQNRNRFRQSDRHAAGSDSIFAASSTGLC